MASSATTTASTLPPSGTPTLVFESPATLTACQTARIRWTNQNSFDWSSEFIALYVDNAGVNQAIPSPSTSASSSAAVATSAAAVASSSSSTSTIASISAALATSSGASLTVTRVSFPLPSLSKRSTIPINQTIEVLHPANVAYQWDSVNLPAGRYHIRAYSNNPISNTGANAGSVGAGALLGTTADFTVVEDQGSALCLDAAANKILSDSVAAAAASRTQSSGAVASSSASVSVGTGSTGAEAAAGSSSSSKTSGGTIAGIVIGVIGGLALLALLFFCWRKRRRQRSSPDTFQHRDTGMGALGNSRSRSANRLSSFGEAGSRERGGVPVGSFESAEKSANPSGSLSSNGVEEVPMTAVLGMNRQGSFVDDGSGTEYLTPLPTAASSSSFNNQLPLPATISPFASFSDRQDVLPDPFAGGTPSSGHVTPVLSRSRQPSFSGAGATTPPKSPGVDAAAKMQRKPSVGRRKPVPQIEPGEETPRRPSAPVMGTPKVADAQPQRKSYILTADPPVGPR